ncbi:hypothetical protein JCM10213_003185 [Rhodosporidiobolus nylandii]
MPTPPPHSQLTALPPPILDRILSTALAASPPLRSTLLASLGKTVNQSFLRIAAEHIELQDDDAVLVQAEEDNKDVGDPRRSSLLSAVWGSPAVAQNVKALTVVRPVVSASEVAHGEDGERPPFAEDDDDFSPTSVPIPPLDAPSFFLLLSRLPNLTSFTWSSYRAPPEQLCAALGAAAPQLKAFSLDLLPSPFEADAGNGAPGSPPLGGGHAGTHGAHGPRWDAPGLSSLPGGLTSLSLSSLSQAGCKSLGGALPLFLSLESLEIAKTLFVDDALLQDVGQGAARTLRRFKVRDMGGTKLSEAGLAEVLNGCEGLEVLELEGVEGRLSRTCWSRLSPLPSSLHTLRLLYSESSPHKSWALDHLSSLPSLLSSSSLHTLTLGRKVPHPAALLPGSHQLARFPIDPVLAPRVLGKQEIDAIAERGDAWKTLELDLFKVDTDGLKSLLEAAPEVKRLKVMFDGPFRNILTLTTSFSSAHSLRHFLLSIPPEHVPETAALTPSVYLSALASLDSAPSSPPPGESPPLPASPTPASGRRGSAVSSSEKEEKSASGLKLKEIDSLLPPTRDWRRFLKKAHSLEAVSWVGRGGIGTWRFSKPGGTSLVKVEFEPTRPKEGATGEGAEGALPASAVAPQSPSPTHLRPRRRSSASLAGSCLSGLSLSPTSERGAGGFSPFSSPSGGGGGGADVGGSPYSAASSYPGSMMSFTAAGVKTSPVQEFSSPFGGGGGHRRRSTTQSSGSSSYGFPHSGGALGLGVAPQHSPPLLAPAPEVDEPLPAVGWASPPEPKDGAKSDKEKEKKERPKLTAANSAASTSPPPPAPPKSWSRIAASAPSQQQQSQGKKVSASAGDPPSPTQEKRERESRERSPKEEKKEGGGGGGGERRRRGGQGRRNAGAAK